MVSFVILHYQAFEETISCIKEIDKHILGKKKIVIVDNNSPNGSGFKLKELYNNRDDIIVHLTDDNLGFAKGNNEGFAIAKKDNPDFVVVMNNDVMLIQDGTDTIIEKAFKEEAFDIMGPDIFSTREKYHQNPQRKRNYTLQELEKYAKKTRFKMEHKWMLRIKYMLPFTSGKSKHSDKYEASVIRNCVLHGACYVFSKKYIQSHDNCFYNNTFMYFESYILHYLAEREGLKLVYYPGMKVEHHEDVATDLTYSDMYKKSVFTNQCLLDSCEEFMRVMKNNKIRIDGICHI